MSTPKLLLAALALSTACSDPSEPESAPVLLIGLDGFEWNVALPMLKRGELPHLAELMERGNFGNLGTFQPTLSPIIWTSIATGRTPNEHGIRSFTKPQRPGDGSPPELYDNSDRLTKAVWNIASDAKKRVAVIGWWMTFPVEPVNGLMVSQTNSEEQVDVRYGRNIWKGGFLPDTPGQVYPLAAESAVIAHADRAAAELDHELEAIFGSFPHPLTPLGKQLWQNTRWSFLADSTYLRIAEEALAASEPYDLTCVYLGGPDVVGHRFWRYYRPERFEHAPTDAELANFSEFLEDYYRWTDTALGRLLEAAPNETNVVIVSDHGMHAVNRGQVFDAQNIPQNVNSGHHMTAPAGVWIAAGPDLVDASTQSVAELTRAELANLASVFDVAPTVLALLDVPVGEDFAGQVARGALTSEFTTAHPLRTVPTHDSASFLASREQLAEIAAGADPSTVLERLKKLGYIGDDSAESALRGPETKE